MATTFLAGVANARIFKGNDLFATAKTLVDSSITIGVSAEDIRAGKGAKLYGKYFHTSTFDLKMTDAMFKLEYIAANVGADYSLGGEVFATETITTGASGAKTFKEIAKPMVSGSEDIYAYVKEVNSDKWYTFSVTENGITVGDTAVNDITYQLKATTEYCVQYIVTNESARKVTINANFTPDTLCVYLDADLFSGDSQNPQTGTKVGTVTIKVPRFLLSGSQEIAMNMTGAAQTPFEGSALAANASGCDGEGIYAEIIEVIDGETWTNRVNQILVGGMNNLTGGEAIMVYVHVDNRVKQLDLSHATSTTSGFNPYTITCKKDGNTYSLIDNPNFAAATASPATYVFTYQAYAWNREHTAVEPSGSAVTQTVIIPASE